VGISFVHFMDSLGLLDPFFERSAETLYLTRSEFDSLDRLTKKGYLRADTVRWLKSKKLVQAAPAAGRRGDADATVDAEVQSTVERFRQMKLKFIISEDANLRSRLKGTGVRVISTVDMIAHMAKKGSITAAEATLAIDALRTFRWYNDSVLDEVQRRIGGSR
jgi:hypothetical protein